MPLYVYIAGTQKANKNLAQKYLEHWYATSVLMREVPLDQPEGSDIWEKSVEIKKSCLYKFRNHKQNCDFEISYASELC